MPPDIASIYHVLADIARARRSVRAFLPDRIPDTVLDACFDPAILAPSSHNLEVWRFLDISGRENRTGFASCASISPRLCARRSLLSPLRVLISGARVQKAITRVSAARAATWNSFMPPSLMRRSKDEAARPRASTHGRHAQSVAPA